MRTLSLLMLVCVLVLPSCGDSATPRKPDRVTVDVAPVRGILSAVLVDGVEVRTLVPDAASPHGFALRPSDVRALRTSGLVVHVGSGLSLEIDRAVDAHGGGAEVLVMGDMLGIDPGDHAGHPHAPGEACDHGGVDPHLWLDPALVRGFYEGIPDRLIGVWVDESRLDAAITLVAEIEARIDAMRETLEGTRIVTQHHAFGRLCERLGIEVVDTVRDGAHLDPSPSGVAALASTLKGSGVDAVFVEPQFPSALSERLAQSSGVRVGVLDPLGSGDWFTMMDEILTTLGGIGGGGG